MKNASGTVTGRKIDELKNHQLIEDLKEIVLQGKNRDIPLTLVYWQLGERLSRQENLNLFRLALEIKIPRTTLSRALLFTKKYKNPPQSKNLSWSHYRELLAIEDGGLRKILEQRVETEGLSKDALINFIKEARLNNGLIGQAKTLTRPTAPTYIYKAVVNRVIDGDTLLLTIDLGFEVLKEQKIRLAQINAAEITTESGRKAFEFVQERLANVDFVMVKTNKVDIFGRYIGDIFYHPSGAKLDSTAVPELSAGEAVKKMSKDRIFIEGNYLNEEIVKAGLAEIY